MTVALGVLREIERWKLEAKEEDNSRYFLPIPDLDSLLEGRLCYVIGRKGSGKSAIAEHIRGLSSYDTLVRSLSFKNFPFNDLYAHEDKGYNSPSQYITFWKFVIYSAVCEMMAHNEAVLPDVSVPLSKYFDVDFEKALSRTITKLTSRGGTLTILHSGVSGNESKTVIANDAPWYERVSILEDIIEKYCDKSKYYIVFDELDEDYKDILNIDKKQKYFDLLAGLFKAVSEIRSRFSKHLNVMPIIFIRDDIFDIIEDNDKNKWEDLSITLSWTKERLESLAAFRISRAIDPTDDSLSFIDAMATIFSTPTIRTGYNHKTKHHVFKYILDRTLMRPRDVTSFLRECAKVAVTKRSGCISIEDIRSAERAYSRRFRKEFVDEMHSVFPRVNEVFDLISSVRKQTLTIGELRHKYINLQKAHPDMVDFEVACKLLFHFSVIGNQPQQMTANVFKYRDADAQMNFGEKIILHRGMLRSLQIA